MNPGLTRTMVRAAGVGLVGLWAEVQWVAHHDYPEFPDLDPSGTFGEAGTRPIRIAALGDSSITGPGLESPDQIWVRQAIKPITQRSSVVLDAFAVGGARIQDVLDDQIPRMDGRRYDIVLLSVAANDAIHGMPYFRIVQMLEVAVDRVLESCEILILAGVGDIGTAPRLPTPLRHVATLQARSTDHAHAAVAAKRHRVRKVAMWEETTQAFRSGSDLFSPDRYHPNVYGHALWADALQPVLLDAAETVSQGMAV